MLVTLKKSQTGETRARRGADRRCDSPVRMRELEKQLLLLQKSNQSLQRDLMHYKHLQNALQESQERLNGAFAYAPIGVSLVALDGRWLQVNRALCDLIGYSEAELLALSFQEVTHPDDLATDLDYVRRTLSGEIDTYQMEKRYVHARGHVIPALLTVSMVRDDAGQPRYFVSQIQDISALKQAEMKSVRLARVYAVLSGINGLIVRATNRDELFREACRVAVDSGQFRMAWIGVVDRRLMQIVPVASAGDEDFLKSITLRLSIEDDAPLGHGPAALAVRQKEAFITNDLANDPRILYKKVPLERGTRAMAFLPILIDGKAVAMLSLHATEVGYFDAEEMKLLHELVNDVAFAIDHIEKRDRLEFQAYYDALTGLANRTLFLERLGQYERSAARDGHQMALFLIDLERFKNVNDSLGRHMGDALLKQVAQWLQTHVGEASLLARVTADHFAIVLPVVRQGGNVARLVDKMLDAFLKHTFELNHAPLRIGVKVGVGLFPEHGTDAETLFKHAEAALKKAKISGQKCLFYTEQMTASVANKLTLETQLRQAIEREEFVLHYQPKIQLADGKLTSCEALIRWNDPSTGLVPPGLFIPILEETGMIYDVGRWAMRRAIKDYLRWQKAGLRAVRIAVNVSPLQLRHHDFVAEVQQAISIDPEAARGLELEITESLIMEDVKHSIASLEAIRALGVTIAIDDFGTGFSSLSYLSKLPIDTLKIDRSFIIEMMNGPQGLALVTTIISLAHSLKLKVVAEGVETDAQAQQLRTLACNEMQGFLFSKPVPADLFEQRFLR